MQVYAERERYESRSSNIHIFDRGGIYTRRAAYIFLNYRETRDDKHSSIGCVMVRHERVLTLFRRWGLSPVSGSKKVVVRSGLPWLILAQRSEGTTMEFVASGYRGKVG